MSPHPFGRRSRRGIAEMDSLGCIDQAVEKGINFWTAHSLADFAGMIDHSPPEAAMRCSHTAVVDRSLELGRKEVDWPYSLGHIRPVRGLEVSTDNHGSLVADSDRSRTDYQSLVGPDPGNFQQTF